MTLLAIVAGLITGFVLGLLGSGGSIIALPALIYLLGVAPKSAIAMSLGVVAVTATLAAFNHARRGNVDLKVALVFASFGALGTFSGTRLGVVTPVGIQLTLFALVMYAAAWRMRKRPVALPVAAGGLKLSADGTAALGGCQHFFSPCMAHIALAGVGVGLLTGLVGVGGGFLIVPALVLLSGVSMTQAVGTSLAIVAANSATGFAGYLGGVPIAWNIMAGFTAVTVPGNEPHEGPPPAMVIRGQVVEPSDGVIVAPEDIVAVLAKAGLCARIEDCHAELERVQDDFLTEQGV